MRHNATHSALVVALLVLPGCVGLGVGGKVEKPVRYHFQAEEGAELIVDAPGGFRINAKGPVSIITEGAAMYEPVPGAGDDG